MAHYDTKANRLARTSSPYLLQHAYNPVDWYPWGEEALEKAKKEDRPIFLSIGYSTCHWCHVMERESFEDETVAKMMNESFVSIKVDREERPDLDAVYMKACTLATGRGGWPLTVIMTPELEPFFLGTYIPKRARWGSPGMIELIAHIKEMWRNNREEVLSTSMQIAEALRSIRSDRPGDDLDISVIEKAVGSLDRSYDHVYGGFNTAPKFPSPHNGMLLLRYWKRTNDEKALDMVKGTLDHMILGGINDHVGGGFHRYSTDAEWRVPHFEKMLYDQAMIALLLLEAYQITKEERYADAVRSTLDYVIRDLSDPSGGFHSAEDADSEGEEGKFYVWSYAELKRILTDSEFALLRSVFDVKEEGNFRDEATGKGTKQNILFMGSKTDGSKKEQMGSILKRLKDVRDKRIRPAKDDKVLADWNGMMISALAKASRVLKDPSYAARASKAASFILGSMRRSDGGLLHRYRKGDSDIDGFLEDYAYVIQGLLDLYEATYDPYLLSEALKLNRIVLDEFLDDENGGFFQTSAKAEKVLIRNKDCYDGAIPSGNSVQMMNLIRLFRITGSIKFEEEADRIARTFSIDVKRAPTAFSYLLCALDMAIGPSSEFKIAGDRDDPKTKEMIDIFNSRYDPNAILLLIDGEGLKEIVPNLEDYPAVDGKATAYVCSGNRCGIPTGDPEKLREILLRPDNLS